ncbi:hypothetical protein E6H30_03505 [Candidatus Bathyarchaeota archaeon]|nr:MAG: hypothetical protein E6H30_03505 [Candidatus Bathyarchaeota archaeon]
MQSAISDEAKRVLDEAKERGIILRLFGGVAVKYHCPSATHRSLQRSYPDLDFFGRGKQGREVRKLFTDLGYEPNQRFNALHGATRLIYEDGKSQRVVDIFLDVFRMCHTLHLGDRLTLDDYTIPISDLLLTKLQVVETNEKDIQDLIAILKDHDVVERIDSGDREVIDTGYISTLCADDWGLCKTISLTLKKLLTFLPKYGLELEAKQVLGARIDKLLHAIETVPKSLKWKLRDKVGERKRWYDLPEVPIRTQSVSSA